MDHAPSLVDVLVNWLPMIVLIGVWIYFMKAGGGLSYGKYLEQHLSETKRHNELLEQILRRLSDTTGGKS